LKKKELSESLKFDVDAAEKDDKAEEKTGKDAEESKDQKKE
jgi:hypothetical protein